MPPSAWLLAAGLALAWARGAEQACSAAEPDALASPALLQTKAAHGAALRALREEFGPLLEEGAQTFQAHATHEVRTEWKAEKKCSGSGEGCVHHMTRKVHQIWKTCPDGVCKKTEECWGTGCKPGHDTQLLEERDSAEDLSAPETSGAFVLETTWLSGGREIAEGDARLEADGQSGKEGDALLEEEGGQHGDAQDGWRWGWGNLPTLPPLPPMPGRTTMPPMQSRGSGGGNVNTMQPGHGVPTWRPHNPWYTPPPGGHWGGGWDVGSRNTPQPAHARYGVPTTDSPPRLTTPPPSLAAVHETKTRKVWEHCTGSACWTEECYGKACTCKNKVCTDTSG